MKRVAVVIILFVSSALQAQKFPQAPQGLICWQETRKLTWADFQAPVNELGRDDFYDTRSAYVTPRITAKGVTDGAGRNNFIVRAALDPRAAWVRDSTVRTASLLAHEQLHFDICELVARKLRGRLAHLYKVEADVFDPKFAPEIKRIIAEKDVLNRACDEETAHGLLEEEQAKWAERIKRDLAAWRQYQSTDSTCYPD